MGAQHKTPVMIFIPKMVEQFLLNTTIRKEVFVVVTNVDTVHTNLNMKNTTQNF